MTKGWHRYFSVPVMMFLYRKTTQWRFAVYTDSGIKNGFLEGVDRACDPHGAEAALLHIMATLVGPRVLCWSNGSNFQLDCWSATINADVNWVGGRVNQQVLGTRWVRYGDSAGRFRFREKVTGHVGTGAGSWWH